VQAGEIGRVFLASVRVKLRRSAAYFESAAWRARKAEAGGGVLMIQAIHTLDLLLWTLGMPHRVLGRIATAVHAVEVEDLAVGILEFRGGALAVMEATTAAIPEHPPELELHGGGGTAALFDSRGFLSFWCSTLDRPASLRDRWRRHAEDFREQEEPALPSQAAVEPHVENIRDFVAAVRERRPPLVDGVEARKSLLVIRALYASTATGGWIPVEGG
jgi:predicted dehydrogenase